MSELLIKYITVLAWIFGIGSVLLLTLRIWFRNIYEGSIEQVRDQLQGQHLVYLLMVPIIIAIFCWSWIIII